MSVISAADVNKLRQMTGAGMMDCKKALTEAEGDFEKAIEILRKKGQKVSASRSDRDAKEGSVFVKSSEDKKEAVLIALNCETDFVGKNEEFQSLGKLIAETAFTNKPATKEALLALTVGNLSINDKIVELVGKIGEKIEVSEYIHMKGEAVVAYIHAGAKLGVLVSLKGVNGKDVTDAGKDVGMQIAAMNPVAVDVAKKFHPDLVLLDIMMPKMDGVETCRLLREIPELQKTFIVFLTARAEEYSEVAAFDVGADDYINKPIKPRALMSRISALFRRDFKKTNPSSTITIGDLTIDRTSYTIKIQNREINLPKKEFELLFFLAQNPNKVFSREDLLLNIWGSDVYVLARTVDVHIRKVREKIGEDYISTVKGVGYKFSLS